MFLAATSASRGKSPRRFTEITSLSLARFDTTGTPRRFDSVTCISDAAYRAMPHTEQCRIQNYAACRVTSHAQRFGNPLDENTVVQSVDVSVVVDIEMGVEARRCGRG